MIDDIVFEVDVFILEIPVGLIGGLITSYSMDGHNYDFNQISGGEISSIFIN